MLTESDIFAAGDSEPRPASACVFVLFGATGDLASRKIAPALYNLRKAGLLAENTAVLGVARRPRSDAQFRDEMLHAIHNHSRTQPVDMDLWERFSQCWHYHVTHADSPDEYRTLRDRLSEMDRRYGTGGSRVFYMAMTPDTFTTIVKNLGEAGMNCCEEPGGFARLIVDPRFETVPMLLETPLGDDEQGHARDLVTLRSSSAPEGTTT